MFQTDGTKPPVTPSDRVHEKGRLTSMVMEPPEGTAEQDRLLGGGGGGCLIAEGGIFIV